MQALRRQPHRIAGLPTGARLLLALVLASSLWAQEPAPAVVVTLSLDVARLVRGKTTTLRVFGQVHPDLRPGADRIFSWALDLRNSNGTVAAADFDRLEKAASDNDPDFSGNGVADGPDLFGVHDTFMNRPGAGVAEPIELFSVPVQALAVGHSLFTVQPGTGAPFGADFLVAPVAGDEPWVGGDYAQAAAELEVTSGLEDLPPLPLSVLPAELPGQIVIDFPVEAGFDYTVQSQTDIAGSVWEALPEAPHNTGRLVVSIVSPAHRFFRVRVDVR